MNNYAVAFVNLIDNELTVEIVTAYNEIEAILLHSAIVDTFGDGLPENFPTNLERIYEEFFNLDCLVAVTKV